MKKVAIVVNSFPSLSESFIQRKVDFLSKADLNVTVISQTKGADGILNSDYLDVDIIRSPFSFGLIKKAFHLIFVWIRHPQMLFKIFRIRETKSIKGFIETILLYTPFLNRNFQIIHFGFSGLAVKYKPVIPLLQETSKVFVSCRGSAEKIKPIVDVLRKKELGEIFQMVDRIHCVSEDMVQTCVSYGMSQKKAFVNYPSVDPTKFQNESSRDHVNSDSTRIRIVTVGRLHWVKNLEMLLHVVNALHKEGVNLHLTIVGDGPEKEKLHYLRSSLGLMSIIDFTGPLSSSEVQQTLKASDIYAHTSMSEGISNSVLEAMAMGLPVITTDAGGMKEVISNNVNGLLIPCFDLDLYIKELGRMINEPELRNTFSKNGRATIVARFSLNHQLQVFLDEYNKC